MSATTEDKLGEAESPGGPQGLVSSGAPEGSSASKGPGGLDAPDAEIVRRLRSVAGHVRGIERMIGEGAYCIDVVNQVHAVQQALKKVSGLVLDRHLHSCVTSVIRGEDASERERVIDEILNIFEATGKP